MAVSMEDIKTLRAKTSAGVGLCKEALEATNGDMEKAIDYVNQRSDVIGRLHDMTGAKIGFCKMAYEEAGQDLEKAVQIIKDRGWEGEIGFDAPKEGIIGSYAHGSDQKTVALVEITCKTDFVARNQQFKDFAHEMALQAAATKPLYGSRNSIPEEKIEELRNMFMAEVKEQNKPADIVEKIIEGKFNKFYQENCLLDQKWFKDETKTVKSLLDEIVATLGEPMEIRRVLVWTFGE